LTRSEKKDNCKIQVNKAMTRIAKATLNIRKTGKENTFDMKNIGGSEQRMIKKNTCYISIGP
jgi:uncharacterized protein YjdB